MDQYPEVSVQERECQDWTSSRHDSASSVAKAAAATQHAQPITTTSSQPAQEAAPRTSSFPSPSTHSAHRSDSTTSKSSNEEDSQRIEEDYARYTDAPPPYSEKAYEGKSEDEQTSMRMTDYAKEISRMMGRQLVRGLKIDERKQGKKESKAK